MLQSPISSFVPARHTIIHMAPVCCGFGALIMFFHERTTSSWYSQQHLQPSVVMVVHESLSGALMSTKRGVKETPFYHEEMANRSSILQFVRARTVAGAITIATPAIMTGMTAFTDEGVDLISSVSLAVEFKAAGYETAIFSYRTDWTGAMWANMNGILTDYYDVIHDPESTGNPLVNEFGMDDRLNTANFGEWLNTTRNASKPFFAVPIWNNNHYPHLVDENIFTGSTNEDRYFASLEIADDGLRDTFAAVEKAGLMGDTVMIGCGDHGETPGTNYKRLMVLDVPILHVPLWMHIPDHYVEDRDMLKAHLNRSVSTLDIVPTLRHLTSLGEYRPDELGDCLTGLDLLDPLNEPIDDVDDQVLVGWHRRPLETDGIASFVQGDHGVLLYTNEPWRNVKIEFRVDDLNPVHHRFETSVENMQQQHRVH